MATVTLGHSVPYDALSAGSPIQLGQSPFLEGERCVLHISFSPDAAGSGVVKVQGSDDGSVWVDKFNITNVAPSTSDTVRCHKYMRLGVTTAGSAGTVSAYLVGVT